MSDTVVVMHDGDIQQIGSPIDIYNEPINAFVASFIGESNIIDGIMLRDFMVGLRATSLPVWIRALATTSWCRLWCAPRTFRWCRPFRASSPAW